MSGWNRTELLRYDPSCRFSLREGVDFSYKNIGESLGSFVICNSLYISLTFLAMNPCQRSHGAKDNKVVLFFG